jgi:hypothetical protein
MLEPNESSPPLLNRRTVLRLGLTGGGAAGILVLKRIFGHQPSSNSPPPDFEAEAKSATKVSATAESLQQHPTELNQQLEYLKNNQPELWNRSLTLNWFWRDQNYGVFPTAGAGFIQAETPNHQLILTVDHVLSYSPLTKPDSALGDLSQLQISQPYRQSSPYPQTFNHNPDHPTISFISDQRTVLAAIIIEKNPPTQTTLPWLNLATKIEPNDPVYGLFPGRIPDEYHLPIFPYIGHIKSQRLTLPEAYKSFVSASIGAHKGASGSAVTNGSQEVVGFVQMQTPNDPDSFSCVGAQDINYLASPILDIIAPSAR